MVFTVGCNVMSQNAVWAGVSIACSLMVGIYAFGAASGANFNPAVSVALGLTKKMDDGWKQVGAYCAVQVIAGLVASFGYSALFGPFDLGPAKGFNMYQAILCEIFYTFMLVFVVLNTAASKKLGGKNQFYGLAIGFVIIAGAYGAGAVSGGCFNPAVAIAIDSSSIFLSGFGNCGFYTIAELAGAALAAFAFVQCRPEEQKTVLKPEEAGIKSKLLCEFIGTFMLVLTVGLNVLASSKAAAFSIAASLMCMIMAIGDISGGHFNPAVTLALFLSGRNITTLDEAVKYVVAQVIGGLAAAFTYALIHEGKTFGLGPVGSHGWHEVAVAETLFTFVLTFVVLCVASTATKPKPAPEFIGFIIGSCVTVGGFAIGKVSGGSMNPAVSFGIAAANVMNGGFFVRALLYSAFELFGAAIAAALFVATHPDEYAKQH